LKKNFLFYLIALAILCFTSTQTFAQYDKAYFFNLGRRNLIDNKFPQAIDNFNTLIKADTTLYDAYFFRGIAKYNLNDYIGALSDFNTAIHKNPVFTQAYHYRAITFSQLNRFDDALKDYDHAIDLRPDYLGIYYSRGITYLMSQQLAKAIEDFNRFLRFEPQAGDAYLNRGTAYLLQKDTVSALADYNKAISINIFDAQAFTRRARIYALQEENEKALADLNKSIALDSTNSFSYFNRALVRYNMKDINGTLSDLNKVLESDPNNALTYYNRALIRSQIGDYNNALADYAKVIEINPNNVLVYYNRAAVLIELKNYMSAIDDYTKAINLYPDFANAYVNRSYIKSMLGMANDAKKDYEIAQKKIAQYREQMKDSTFSIYADTSKRFNQLLALDADFTKKTFDSNILQDRKVDIVLKPLFKFTLGAEKSTLPLDKQFFNTRFEQFHKLEGITEMDITDKETKLIYDELIRYDSHANELIIQKPDDPVSYFYKGVTQGLLKQYSSSINYYSKAIEMDSKNPFFYINRSAIQAEMIDFVSSIENNMPVLALDGTSTMRIREKKDMRTYNYSEAIDDLNKAEKLASDFTYIYYNRGNLKCLSNQMPEAIEDYTKAIKLYPYYGEAYFNRGLIQIYLRDTEKGCLDISKSGELGMEEAYNIIKKYCLKEPNE
jgi:tetratricopeptide (TPR) repeat protein